MSLALSLSTSDLFTTPVLLPYFHNSLPIFLLTLWVAKTFVLGMAEYHFVRQNVRSISDDKLQRMWHTIFQNRASDMAEADGREDSTSTRDSVEDGSLLSQLELNDDDQYGCMSRSQAWNLYVSHFLSTWNMRTYEFAAVCWDLRITDEGVTDILRSYSRLRHTLIRFSLLLYGKTWLAKHCILLRKLIDWKWYNSYVSSYVLLIRCGTMDRSRFGQAQDAHYHHHS